jgi:hypothetical protein
MAKKRTYKETKDFIEAGGWELLQNNYINSKLPLLCRCDKGHEILIPFNKIQNRKFSCKECNKIIKNEEVRKRQEKFVRKIIKSNELTLIKYVSKTEIHLKCKNNCEYITSLDCVRVKSACPNCSKNAKIPKEFVLEKIKEKGWDFISCNEGAISMENIICKCNNGHVISVPWSNIINDKQCLECSGNKKYTIEKINEMAAKKGWELLSTNYETRRSIMECICDKGHHIKIPASYIIGGRNCYACFEETKITMDNVKATANLLNFKVKTSNYVNNRTKMHFECKNGHNLFVTYSRLKGMTHCHKCHRNYSEKIARDYLQEITPYKWDSIKPDWLNPKNNGNKHFNLQLDLWCNELKIGIEVQGPQHYNFPNHCHRKIEDFTNQQKRDNIKKEMCLRLKITLVEIKDISFYQTREKLIEGLNKELIKLKIIT